MADLGMDEHRQSFAAPMCNPDPSSIRVESWVLAEDQTRDVLNRVKPTLDSDDKRKDVIEYMRKLIRCNLRLEVSPYGSVPLKTYLPDGDIDLTVLSTPALDDLLPSEVLRVLQEQENNANTEFEIKYTQFIDAEVKLVKCLVQDIVVDISFNQLAGLSTLCFLEQPHTRCSTWLDIYLRVGNFSPLNFHVFHASLNSPLQVLYRFLDYYAKFDWDNYCISLNGPVCKSSLPILAVETVDTQGTDVLLGDEFRKNCMHMFIAPFKGAEIDLHTFNLKNLNIIDPLKANNNLGRCVHKGNYFRIRSAFRYGARRLGKILQQTNINIKDEIKVFFNNTFQTHKPRYGPDSSSLLAANGFGTLSMLSLSEAYYEDDLYSSSSNGDFDDYILTESNLETEPVEEKKDLELWMERGGASKLVDGDNLYYDAKEKDASDDDIEEIVFLDLTGDYDAQVRSLLYGQACHGYALSTAMVQASRTKGRRTGCGPPVSNGPHHHRASHGSYGPKLAVEVNHASQTHQQASLVNSTANGIADQSRKLEFGSFRSMPKNPSNGQSLKVDAYGGKQGRIRENPSHLKNEDEFPSLST